MRRPPPLRAHDYWEDTGRILVELRVTGTELQRLQREALRLGLVDRHTGPYTPADRRTLARAVVRRLIDARLAALAAQEHA